MVGVFTFRGERGKGRVGEGGREENRMGGRGSTPVKWSVCKGFSRVDMRREGSSPARSRVFVDCLTYSQSSQVNMAASFYTSKPHSSFQLPN